MAATGAADARPCDELAIFRVFAACAHDPKTLLLDVRPHKDFKKSHISLSYCVRLATSGSFLADYSQNQYAQPWTQDLWWGKPVIMYGPPGLSKDHPVIKFLAGQQRCGSLSYFKGGFEAFQAKYPFLCTASVKATSAKKFPSVILPGFLYLGDWGDAEQHERLAELNIKRIVTVHNHPERLKLLPGTKQLKIELPDTESADISSHFNATYEFIADAERAKQPVLVHCGAGVSRSACIVMQFLMRRKLWSAQQARDHCIAARSLVCPNDGFWRLLCALEAPLGIVKRSDPDATMGYAGADAPAVQLHAEAAGQPVQVRMLTAREVQLAEEVSAKAAALAAAAAARAAQEEQELEQQQGDGEGSPRERRRSRSRSRSRSPDGHKRQRSRSRSGDGDGSDKQQGKRKSRWAAAADAPPQPPPAAAAAPLQPPEQPQQPQQQRPSGGWLVKLEVCKPEGMVGQLLLGPIKPLHQRVIFGRAPACNVVLEHASISRQHAQLSVDASGGVVVTDLGSAHGTKLGDAWLKPQAPRTLMVGSRLQFGASTRTYKLLEVVVQQ